MMLTACRKVPSGDLNAIKLRRFTLLSLGEGWRMRYFKSLTHIAEKTAKCIYFELFLAG